MKDIAGKTGRVVGPFGNIWVMAHLDMMTGETVPVGEHDLAHVSWLGQGSVKFIREDGEPVIIHAQNYIYVPAHYRHGIEVLEDHTNWTCFHVRLDGDGLPEMTLEHGKHFLVQVTD
jgi:quercetin dioxygenase-like cupin family protein